MSRHYSHINTAGTILKGYDGKQPFAQVIKLFFSKHKKYGSRDRRQIKALCYSYFRVAHVLGTEMDMEEKVILSYHLCADGETPLITAIKPEWKAENLMSIQDKFKKYGLDAGALFPFLNKLEPGIDAEKFAKSHLEQPDLFLRLRPGQADNVKKKLDKEGISYKALSDTGLALPSTTKVQDILEINKEVVIQDYASQRVGALLAKVQVLSSEGRKPGRFRVWDCCAGSGGKAILASDVLDNIDLSVNDIRPTILHNLKVRLRQANIRAYRSQEIDLTDRSKINEFRSYNLVIADVPCTGSGTWGRTPERLHSLKEEDISRYTQLQERITHNVITKIKKGGYLLYITCSVYKEENSDIVAGLLEKGFDLIQSDVYLGYPYKSDTMYAALLKKV